MRCRRPLSVRPDRLVDQATFPEHFQNITLSVLLAKNIDLKSRAFKEKFGHAFNGRCVVLLILLTFVALEVRNLVRKVVRNYQP
jgi:hypothetical protein